MPMLAGGPVSLEDNHGFYPPAFEIGRALEHYRRSKRRPFPALLKTRFFYYEQEVGEVMTDEGVDIQDDSFTDVILCDSEGKELQKYQFQSLSKRMRVIK